VVKTSEETIDEFFGEKKKSSSKQLFVAEQEEEITELEAKDGKSEPAVTEDIETVIAKTETSHEENTTETSSEDTTLIDAYLEKKKSKSK